MRIHYVHERARNGNGIPLILTHGWPSSFVEHLQIAPLLAETFDVVIPSVPGYGFSGRPAHTTTRDTARLWHALMRSLGYDRYGAQGGDFGASVTTYMALDDPAPLLGIHLHQIDDTPYTGPGSRPLSETEREYREAVARVGRDRARLQLDPVDEAADRRLRAQRLAGRPRRLDRREVALVERLAWRTSTATCCSRT